MFKYMYKKRHNLDLKDFPELPSIGNPPIFKDFSVPNGKSSVIRNFSDLPADIKSLMKDSSNSESTMIKRSFEFTIKL